MTPRLRTLIAVAVVLLGVALAWRLAWTCDDAFISYRYALNWIDGHGLVYNRGERVEGMTNLLWTVWIAAGLLLGVAATTWSIVWGLAAFAATLALLAALDRRVAPLALPTSALFLVLCPEVLIFATSGLETATFTLCAVGGYALVAFDDEPPPMRLAAAGAVFAAGALLRPDGGIFFAVTAAYVLVRRGPRALMAVALPFAAIIAAATLWRYVYYGDIVPNTAYAKSASHPWIDQGLVYLRLFLSRYHALFVAAAAGALVAARARAAPLLLAGALALAYTGYIVYVGGDFMFARLLVPVLPFLALLASALLARLLTWRRAVAVLVGATAATALAATPAPLRGSQVVDGVADEWSYYRAFGLDVGAAPARGAALRALFRGLDVRLGFIGGGARLVYHADPPLAVECETGLTDRFIAHLPLGERGRIGHEKKPPLSYLIDTRKVHFVVHRNLESATLRELLAGLPDVRVTLGSIGARVVYWDPPLFDELRRRGAAIPALGETIDGLIAELRRRPPAERAAAYARLRRFYFDRFDDPARDARARALL